MFNTKLKNDKIKKKQFNKTLKSKRIKYKFHIYICDP